MQQKGRVIIKNYYVFICLDDVPILELLLDEKRKSLQNIALIDWKHIQYIILNFKSIKNENAHAIEEGFIKYHQKIMTKQIKYVQVQIDLAHKIILKNERAKWRKNEWNLFQFSEKLFFSNPKEFLEYVIKKQIISKNEIKKFEKALEQMEKEQKIIDTWKQIKSK